MIAQQRACRVGLKHAGKGRRMPDTTLPQATKLRTATHTAFQPLKAVQKEARDNILNGVYLSIFAIYLTPEIKFDE